jgi:hypothetical protein
MKTFSLALAAMAVGAQAHAGHQHAHLHKKDASPVVHKREPAVVTKYAAAATNVVYELNGKILSPDEAKVGIKEGDFVVVGETEPTYTPPPPPPEPTTTSTPKPEPTTSSVDLGAQFIESLSPEPETTTSSTPPAPKPKPEPTTSVVAAPEPSDSSDSGSGSGGGQGLDRDFPDGEISCSTFPSAYGAVGLSWLGFSGWSGLQFTPGFSFSVKSISEIHTGISGDSCSEGCMCSYACPSGYQKTQWPTAQGSTKQSIGGLWCGDDGKLYKTSKTSNKLCEKGAGGVTVQNKMNVQAVLCQTDYPGTEGMYIPSVASPGGTIEITNPIQDEYYQWDGMATSAQYYLNPAGVKKEVACEWDSPNTPANTGNWAPVIVGVGKASDGITYISIFQNKPTSLEKLDFNIKIVGDVSSECSYDASAKKFYGGNDDDGCTVSSSLSVWLT